MTQDRHDPPPFKHSDEALKEMARTVLKAKQNKDDRYLEFVMTMMMRTGLSVDTIQTKIEEMAEQPREA